ncbi:MAG: hypothetical protein KC662_01400 [Candidatus Magasanikbacteria bacterium]|nr:hypothetical protein [Candidatus Magasanikbacteria bacterium]
MPTYIESFLASGAAAAIKKAKPTIIGITGSVGKTTTRQMVVAAMYDPEHKQRVLSSQKNFNNELGLPLTIFGESNYPGKNVFSWIRIVSKAFFAKLGVWKLPADIFVLEMGADKPGDLAFLTQIAPPDISIVTGVSPIDSSLAPVHVEFYPSADAVAEEKSTLVKKVRSNGTVILNADDSRVFAMRHLTDAHVLAYGENDGADIRLISKRILTRSTLHGNEPHALEVVIECYQKPFRFVIEGVFGTSMAYALCAAAATIVALDLPEERLSHLVEHFSAMAGRTRILPGIKSTTLLDDTYNAAPSSTIAALQDLANIEIIAGQRKIACLGENRELGNKAEEMHFRIGQEAARANVDVLVVCGIFATAMKDGALAGGMSADRIHHIEDTPEAGLFLQDLIKPGDIILAKASQGGLDTKGVRMERVIKELMAEPLRAKDLLVRQEGKWVQ